jgi:trans-aconitate methyltransferase
MAASEAWNAEGYDRAARFVTDLGAQVMELLAPQPGEWILDLGCGDGVQMAQMAAMGVRVTGVDGSPDMVAAARAKGLDVTQGDGQALAFDPVFDAVFSNAALHWMTDPDAVISGVARALKPGGRFVAEFGGHGNVAAIHTALLAVLRKRGVDTDLSEIWYFPSPQEHRARLEDAGFSVTEIALIPRPTPVEAGIADWLRMLSAAALHKLPEEDREDAIAEVAALLEPALRTAEGVWTADYQRLRFRAVLT